MALSAERRPKFCSPSPVKVVSIPAKNSWAGRKTVNNQSQSLWAGRDLYRGTPAVTRGLGFSGLVKRITPISRRLQHGRGCGKPFFSESSWAPFNRLLRHARGCWGPVLLNPNLHGYVRLIDSLFTVLRPAQESFTHMETSPLPVKGCKI
jgi:hypothetical protein